MTSHITSLLYRILPGHTLYYVSIGAAVVGAAVGTWHWVRKKRRKNAESAEAPQS